MTANALAALAVAVAETEASATGTVNVNVSAPGNATVSATATSVTGKGMTRAGGVAALNGEGALPLRGVGTTAPGPRHFLRMVKRMMTVPRLLLLTIKLNLFAFRYTDPSFPKFVAITARTTLTLPCYSVVFVDYQ